MECNRDEALRAKSIAEGKLEKKDFAGAKKFAMKAQTLYPGLDGISQMLATLDVHVSAENKINGEVDWYGVLGVKPTADDETIRKQYRMFALMLHPDKNKSVGADGAFKLVSEAWSMLSDTAKRLAYNLRRGSKGFQLKVPMHNTGSSAPRANGCYDFARGASVPKTQNNNVKVPSMPTSTPSYQRTDTVPKTQKNNVKVPSMPTLTPSYQRTDTFWTICHRCDMHYEYLKVYLNNTLLCPNCKEAFRASETEPPISFPKVTNQVPQQRQQNSGNHVPSQNAYGLGRNGATGKKSSSDQSDVNPFRYANHLKNPLPETANVRSMDPSIAAKAASVVQQAQDKLKRAYTESNAPTGWEAHMKKKKLDDDVSKYGMSSNIAQAHSGFGTSITTAGSRICGFFGMSHQPDSATDLTPVETRNMLMEKARKEISKKLIEWRLEAVTKPDYKEKDKAKSSDKEIRRSTSKIAERAERQVNRSYGDKQTQTKDPAMAPITVPDSDFHDFDLDRTEGSFGDNEVWAAYDNDDGMPRFYALISKVISRKPFKLRISWLSSRTNTEFSSLDWVSSGFYKTCGEFRVGRYETCKHLNAFSHKVNWSKGLRGSILILPQKGDIWAVYRNWSSDWNEHTPDEVIHKYDMVTVLDNYSEEHGVSVAPLVKINSFRTVFRPNMEPNLIKRIPKGEMFRFSHRVPNHLLTGQEAGKAPKGCLELDPAATPLELIIQGTKEAEVPVETVSEQVMKSMEITN